MMNSKLYLIVLCSMILCLPMVAQQRSAAPLLQSRSARPQAQTRSAATQVQQRPAAAQTQQRSSAARVQPRTPQNDADSDFEDTPARPTRTSAVQQRPQAAQQKSRPQERMVDEFDETDDWDLQSIVPQDERPVGELEFNGFRDNWYISLGSGAQLLRGEDDHKGKMMSAVTYMPELSIGKLFSPRFGMRFQLTGGSLHGYNDGVSGTYRKWVSNPKYNHGGEFAGQPGYPAQQSVAFETWDPLWTEKGWVLENGPNDPNPMAQIGGDAIQGYFWKPGNIPGENNLYMQHMRYVALNADLTISLLNLIGGYDAYRKVELGFLGGPSLFHKFSGKGSDFYNGIGFNTGLHFRYNVASRWAIYTEGMMNLYPDDFDDQRGNNRSNDFVFQASVGVTYRIGQTTWKSCDNVDYDLLDRLNREINDLRNRPCCPLIEPKPPVANPIISFVEPPKEEIKNRKSSGEAFIVFQVAKSVLLPNLGNNTAELGKITKSIDYVKEVPEVTISGITISGFASPEGNEKANLKLAEDRARALKDYVKVLYRFDENIFSVNTSGENWDGLVKILDETNLTDREKADIADIVRNTDNVVSRKNKLKSYSGGRPYRYLLNDIYPKLRRTDYTISYTVPTFSLARGRELIKTKPGMLSLNEMYQIANSYDKSSLDFKQAMETALTFYPEDYIANINAAALALQNNEISRAEGYLEKVKSSPQAYGNLGVLYMIARKYDDARRYLQMAAEQGNKTAVENLKELDKLQDEMEIYQEDLENYNGEIENYQNAIQRNRAIDE